MVTATTFVGAVESDRPRYRVHLSNRILMSLAMIQLTLIAIGILIVVLLLPTVTPLGQVPDYALVRSAVLDRMNGQILDPMIEIQRGVIAPASSVRGFALHGVTYYYYFEGQQNFDPLSRNLVAASHARIVLRDTNPASTLVIYTLVP